MVKASSSKVPLRLADCRWVMKWQNLGVGFDRTVLFKRATNRALERAVRALPGAERVAWRAAERYVAGRSREDALVVVRDLLANGHGVSVDLFDWSGTGCDAWLSPAVRSPGPTLVLRDLDCLRFLTAVHCIAVGSLFLEQGPGAFAGPNEMAQWVVEYPLGAVVRSSEQFADLGIDDSPCVWMCAQPGPVWNVRPGHSRRVEGGEGRGERDSLVELHKQSHRVNCDARRLDETRNQVQGISRVAGRVYRDRAAVDETPGTWFAPVVELDPQPDCMVVDHGP